MNNSDSGQGKVQKCSICEATWIDGQLFWATGKPGRNIDLAGLVCNPMTIRDEEGSRGCINPCRGNEGGDTWDQRMKDMENMKGVE